MFRIFKKAKNSLLSIARNIKKNEAEHLHHKINSAEGNVLSVYQFRLKTLEFDLAHMDEEERVDMQIIKLNNDIEKHLLTARKILLQTEINQLIKANIENKKMRNLKNKELSNKIITINEQLQNESMEKMFPEREIKDKKMNYNI
ncbi:hypothetical protein [Halomonas hibernica]|uniref:hypothetical protein n=1 Tax=Halomonas hibernica TaxID=2591147 RepID=UPI001552C28A|nr:hypothetical protein [Halomonas hibernica]